MTRLPPPAAQFAAASALLGNCGVQIVLPWPPSVNHYWVRAGRRVVLSDAATEFRRAALQALAQHRIQHRPAWPFTGRVAIRVVLHPPNRARRDIDNHGGKAALDALTHALVLSDDEQVDTLIIQRGNVVRGGCAVITIMPIPEVASGRK